RRLIKSFIDRYLRGIRSHEFQQFAGPEVMAQNYVIFVHILWRLLAKDWVEPKFVIDSLLEIWHFFWCGYEQRVSVGYLAGLPRDERDHVLPMVVDMHAGSQFLAGVYYSAHLTAVYHWEPQRFALRDLWRGMLGECPWEVTEDVLRETRCMVADIMRFEPPSAS